MDTVLRDVRHAVRGLLRAPGLLAAALLTLGIGIGANATVFSFVNALLLRPVPAVREPDTLVSVYTSDFSSGPYGDSSYPDFLSLTRDADAFAALAAFDKTAAVLRAGETSERVRLMRVSGTFFEVLGLAPAAGRAIVEADASGAGSPVAVIGHDLWRRLFDADPRVVGRSVFVDGQPRTIVGVAPPRFGGLNFQGKYELWVPLVGNASDASERGRRGTSIVGRLRPGVTLASAQAQLDGIAAGLAAAYPATNMGTLQRPDAPRPIVVVRYSRNHPEAQAMVTMICAILMATVGLVLLITCANVAGLTLSKVAARRREITIRFALGASRLQVLRALLTESMLLGLGGGALGILFALWTADVLPSFFPAEQIDLLNATVDGRVMAFAASIAVAAGALFGLFPALQAMRGSGHAVLHGDRSNLSDTRTSLVRMGLVFAQVTLTFMLLVSSGLLVRSLVNARHADLGFTTRDAVVASIEIPASELTPQQGALYYRDVLERVRALPGVGAASLAQTAPLNRGPRRGFTLEGYQPRPGEDTELHFNVVDDEYFATMGVPVLQGRAFDARDAAGPRVALVNDMLAQRYFGGRAIGRRMTDARGAASEIVGVVRSGSHLSVQEPPVPVVFYPLSQAYSPRVMLIARTSGDAAPHTDRIGSAARDVNRSVSVFRIMTLDDHLAEALAAERLTATLVSAAGSLALVLAVVGVYGVIAYGVVRRRKEIGLRIALGAQPLKVARLVVTEGLGVTLVGIAAGIGGAFATTQVLGSLLYGIGPRDTATFASAGALLLAVAALAAWVPVRRAVRLDPVEVLRQE